ncbi:MAG: SurA N-terminal domain-containing protein, partial [Verrucomicrobiales bacterium]
MKRTPSILSGIAAVIGLCLLTSPLPAQNDAAPAAPAPETKAAEAPAAKPEAPSEATAPAAPALAETDVVLSVDGTKITVRDVRELFTARYGRQFEQMPAEQRAMIEPQIQQMVMNELISKTLLLNASDKEGFKATDEEIKKSMDEIAAAIPDGVPIEEYAASAGVSLDRIRLQIAEDTKVRKLYEKVTAEVTVPA